MRLLDGIARPSALAALTLILAVLIPPSGRASAAQSNETRVSPPAGLQGVDWVRVDYAQLLDGSALVRTGQPLTAAVREPGLRGTVQPFVDPYSYLLQYAVEMLNGPDALAHTSVTERYPAGVPQPAWVAIFRGGRVQAVADGEDHVRLFLEGTDPDAAYAQHYSVVRHCLNALVPGDGRPLQVEVYAYQHDYAASELKLNTRCSRLSGESFPSKKKELDLAGLSRFFAEGSVLEGAQLSRTEGLVLYGRPGKRLSLRGERLSLADLAVAYRAAFHAGDNQAFVSLDEHADVTRATVNFGGFLEDTRMGSVVLEADKRLKTITGGLDPNTYRDLRQVTRGRIPSFMSASERDLAAGGTGPEGGWIAARLWLYPDKAGVETDPNYEFAAITHPRFTADAERSRKRFVSGDGPEPAASAISPGTREVIEHFNAHYAEYAEAFPELDELSTVARLMALVSWLRQASPDWLDLDSLLAVELPACTTERERVNLLTATVVSCPAEEHVDAAYVAANAKLLHLTPVLDRSIREYFKTSGQLASYLRIPRGAPADATGDDEVRAAEMLAQQGAEPVRSLIRSRQDLRALAEYGVGAGEAGASSRSASAAEIESIERDLGRLEAELAAVKGQLATAEGAEYNRLVDRHNALVKEHSALVSRHREHVLGYNAAQVRTTAVMEIAGGVDLDPRSFQILATTDSERLAELQQLARSAANGEALNARASEWVRSQAAKIPAPPLIPVWPSADWQVAVGTSAENAALAYAQSKVGDRAWGTLVGGDGSWRTGLQEAAGDYYESEFEPREGKFSLRKLVAGKVVQHLIGGVPSAGLIVFQQEKVREVLAPLEKPFKWLGKLL
jgi:hypothetical protein